jgi:predicted nucleotidyltransferase
MDIERAFDDLQRAVDADPALVEEARDRRRKFEAAFGRDSDVTETVAIGSIARGSQIEPIKDVDLVVVYEEHPDWGAAGSSAEKALNETQTRIVGFFGSDGTEERDFVRLARADNHAVKCFLDDPDDPDAFTVDVVPALRQPTGRLRITEKESQDWIDTDPEHLNNCVARRHAAWPQFVRLVRVLKRWNRDHEATMFPLLVEVMAIDHLHESQRSRALQAFFAAAAVAVSPSITDPAGISPIQPLPRRRSCASAA